MQKQNPPLLCNKKLLLLLNDIYAMHDREKKNKSRTPVATKRSNAVCSTHQWPVAIDAASRRHGSLLSALNSLPHSFTRPETYQLFPIWLAVLSSPTEWAGGKLVSLYYVLSSMV
jgi:hypothetical protein